MRGRFLSWGPGELFSDYLRNGSPYHMSKADTFSKHGTERQDTVQQGERVPRWSNYAFSRIAGGRTGNWVV